MSKIVDLHCHTTWRTYITQPVKGRRNLWRQTHNPEIDTSIGRWARIQTKEVAKTSQCNLDACAEGGVGVIFDSLYPVEKGFLNVRKMPRVLMGSDKVDEMIMTIMGIEPNALRRLRTQHDYFPELLQQYALLMKGQGRSPDGAAAYKVPRDFADFQQIRKEHPETIQIIPTIEGAHAFGAGSQAYAGMTMTAHKQLLTENIQTVKNWATPPLFITLAHHFWNQLCGHARSIKPPTNNLLNQSVGMNTGITELGWHVLEELLSYGNGRRILIDTKHMSIKSRLEYFAFVERHNRINPHDKIPIICSHTGVNGQSTLKSSIEKQDKGSKMKSGYFHNWSINVSDEEIRIIHDSGGLIGLMLDKGLLSGLTTQEKIRQRQNPELQKQDFLEMFAKNMFRIVQAVGKVTAWDIICLGTDFDGVITHLDPYPSSASMRNLQADLIQFLETSEYKSNLWMGYSPTELIKKVFEENPIRFMARHFHDRPASSEQFLQGKPWQEQPESSELPLDTGLWIPQDGIKTSFQA